MSKIALSGNASGTGTFTIASPDSNSDRTLNLPDSAGTIATAESTLAQFNASGSAPVYACRAWVNFNGTASSNLSGTYSISGTTTLTVTSTNHGFIVGQAVRLVFTSGSGTANGTYTVVTVPNANTFTITHGTSPTTSGNVTIERNAIRASGNVSSITDNGTGDYTVNFTTAMPDANYQASGVASRASSANTGMITPLDSGFSSSSFRFTTQSGSANSFDPVICTLAIIR
jgi:hypothetical protein